ncbi:aspartyl/asparaginyl beta-hydroxylase domain-containing protein [Streptomyces sp. NPDC051020]|uniref:aspartyl/asparaginyl beta-hydroxylase domain-containing protein n=1 Tax=Streptomyces sp. NPDC051020 TaxID=3155409 RepID=UPI003437FB02
MRLSAVKLLREYDPALLVRDLKEVLSEPWEPERAYKDAGERPLAATNWTGLALRTQGGDPLRTDPGGPGLLPFTPTRILERTPHFQDVLDSLPMELRSVRLLRLGSGAEVGFHRDAHHGFDYGQIRLHIPIITNPDAIIEIGGVSHNWQPGTLWYGDFTLLHRLWNRGQSERVHMVIDALVNPAFLNLMPAELRNDLRTSHVIFNKERITLPDSTLKAMECDFAMPTTLLSTVAGAASKWAQINSDSVPSRLTTTYGNLTIEVMDEPFLSLVPTGTNTFRCEGWTDARFVRVDTDHIILGTRHGNKIRELRLAKA